MEVKVRAKHFRFLPTQARRIKAVKVCGKCKETKQVEAFSKDRRAKDGLGYRCKECINKSSREYYAAGGKEVIDRYREKNKRENLLNIKLDKRKGKVCAGCKEVRPVEAFGRKRQTKDGLKHVCKVCDRERFRKYYTAGGKGVIQRYHRRHEGGIKRVARNAVTSAIRNGSLKGQPCIVCGAKAEAHHSDYSKPLDVDWLCKKHHALWHAHYEPDGCSSRLLSGM